MLKVSKLAPSGTIMLSHDPSRNALSRAMVRSLAEAFSDFHREKSVRAIILTASGTTFCSGVDLKEWYDVSQDADPLEQWECIASEFLELIETMLRFPKPIIVALDGAVHGMGLALVLASDLVVSSPKSVFSSPASKHGLISGLVAPLLAFRCGGGVASRMLLGTESLDAEEAYRVGLVQYKVQPEQIWAKAHAIACQVSECAPESVQMTKRLLNEMIGESLLTNLSSGAALLATVCSTNACLEGLKAFQEKRKPTFE